MPTSTESLLFALQTTADVSGIRAVRDGIAGIPPVIANMSATSRASFDAMDASAKKAAMSAMGVSEAEQMAFISMEKLSGAVAENSAAINVNIGAFVRRGEFVDRNSIEALKAYRAEGDALSALLAQMGAQDAELNKIGASIAKVETAAGRVAAMSPQQTVALPPGGLIDPNAIDKMPRSARTAANALTMLSSAAIMGTGSMQGMIVAAGGLTYGIAAMSDSAKIAASASGIGALITVAGTVALALYEMGKGAKATKEQLQALNDYNAHTITGYVDGLRQENDKLMLEVGRHTGLIDMLREPIVAGGGKGFWEQQVNQIKDFLGYSDPATRKLEKNRELLEAATVEELKLKDAERLRLLTQQDQIDDQIVANRLTVQGAETVRGSLDTYQRQGEQLKTTLDIERARIKTMFDFRDVHGHELALTAKQKEDQRILLDFAERTFGVKREELAIDEQLANAAYKRTSLIAAADIGLGGHDVQAQYEAREQQIRAEGELDIAHGRNRVDVEASVQAKIVALRRSTMQAASDDAKTIIGVLLDSGSKQVKAIGHAADAVRRVQIGAQAAHAAVESAIEFGKAIGSAASMDFRGAALHAASGLALAKAAALGAKESLGGGGAGSGGGGSSGSSGGGTFTPRTGTEGQGNIVINLLTQDPYGQRNIQQVMYELNRAEILKRPPIQVPPTTGLERVA